MSAKLIPIDRAAINGANSQHSGGPRTAANAFCHGLTAASAVLPSEDPAAYEALGRQFFTEYKPATATEIQLVQELVDTSWRFNRIPQLEADLLHDFDIVDAHRLLDNLGIHGRRLSRQFHKALETLGEIQAARRAKRQNEARHTGYVRIDMFRTPIKTD